MRGCRVSLCWEFHSGADGLSVILLTEEHSESRPAVFCYFKCICPKCKLFFFNHSPPISVRCVKCNNMYNACSTNTMPETSTKTNRSVLHILS